MIEICPLSVVVVVVVVIFSHILCSSTELLSQFQLNLVSFMSDGDSIFMPPRSKIGILLLSFLSVCHSAWNFNLAYNFWTVNARALIFHLSIPCDSIPCDRTFPWIQLFFTLWPFFLKTLTLLITFEQGVLELWYSLW